MGYREVDIGRQFVMVLMGTVKMEGMDGIQTGLEDDSCKEDLSIGWLLKLGRLLFLFLFLFPFPSE